MKISKPQKKISKKNIGKKKKKFQKNVIYIIFGREAENFFLLFFVIFLKFFEIFNENLKSGFFFENFNEIFSKYYFNTGKIEV